MAKGKRRKRTDEGASIDTRLMKALSHPLRQRILAALNQRVASPAELSNELDESLGNVSYHVKILAELEAIELVRTAPVRGALEHFYRPMVRAYIDDEHWAQVPESVRRSLSDQTLQQIWDHVRDAADENKLGAEKESTAWINLELDEQGMDELNSAIGDLLERAMDIQAEASVRLAELSSDERDEQANRTELAVMHYHRAAKTRVSAGKPRAKKRSKS